MYTTSPHVKRHIFALPEGQLFATRDLLSYGPRHAVDKALQRLVKAGWIMRLARGIFMKTIDAKTEHMLPTVAQIAAIKAAAFGKQLFIHGKNAASHLKLGLFDNDEPTFLVTGYSSCFCCKAKEGKMVRVHFRSSNAVASKLGDSKLGLIMRGIRQVGKEKLEPLILEKATRGLNRPERQKWRESIKWMPKWMTDLYWRLMRPTKTAMEQPRVSVSLLEDLFELKPGSLAH